MENVPSAAYSVVITWLVVLFVAWFLPLVATILLRWNNEVTRRKIWPFARLLGWGSVLVSLLTWHILNMLKAGASINLVYACTVMCSIALPVLSLSTRANAEKPEMGSGGRLPAWIHTLEKPMLILLCMLYLLGNLSTLKFIQMGTQGPQPLNQLQPMQSQQR